MPYTALSHARVAAKRKPRPDQSLELVKDGAGQPVLSDDEEEEVSRPKSIEPGTEGKEIHYSKLGDMKSRPQHTSPPFIINTHYNILRMH